MRNIAKHQLKNNNWSGQQASQCKHILKGLENEAKHRFSNLQNRQHRPLHNSFRSGAIGYALYPAGLFGININ